MADNDHDIDHAKPVGAMILGAMLLGLIVVIWVWSFIILLTRV